MGAGHTKVKNFDSCLMVLGFFGAAVVFVLFSFDGDCMRVHVASYSS